MAASISTTEGRTSEDGKTARPTGTGFVPGPRGRANTRALGSSVSRSVVSIRGQAEITSKVNGCRASVTDLALRPKVVGCTEESGHKGSKGGTGCDKAPHRGRNTRAPGPRAYRTDTVSSRMPTEVRVTRMEVGNLTSLAPSVPAQPTPLPPPQ